MSRCKCALSGGLGYYGKRQSMLGKSSRWGQWHEGSNYDVRLGDVYYYDAGGYHTWVDVQIRDRKTGEVHSRAGDGKQIGNFHPIWVNWRGQKITVEKLLDI